MAATAPATTNASVDPTNLDLRIAGLTAVIALVATIALNRLITAFGIEDAKELAGAPMAGTPFIYSYLRARLTSRGGLTPAGVVPLSSYEVAWLPLAIVGGLTIVGVQNIASFLGVLVAGDLLVGLGVGIGAGVAVTVACGRYIGVRADRHPIVSAVTAGLLALVLGNALTILFVPEDLREQLGITLSAAYLVSFVPAGLLYAVAGAAGAWWGRRNQEAGYLSYLLKRIDAPTKQSVIQMVYDESRGH
jgi:hypothetical protein